MGSPAVSLPLKLTAKAPENRGTRMEKEIPNLETTIFWGMSFFQSVDSWFVRHLRHLCAQLPRPPLCLTSAARISISDPIRMVPWVATVGTKGQKVNP